MTGRIDRHDDALQIRNIIDRNPTCIDCFERPERTVDFILIYSVKKALASSKRKSRQLRKRALCLICGIVDGIKEEVPEIRPFLIRQRQPRIWVQSLDEL